jgi:MFS family permease
MAGLLSKFALDITALRRSRDYRVIEIGAITSGLGTQAALVAVPYQVFSLTHSTALLGLIGAVELAPTVFVSLFGGALADRLDRRRILFAAQLSTALSAGLLAVLAFAGHPPIWAIFILAGLLAASGSLDMIARGSMIAGLAGEWLRSAIAFNFGMNQVTAIVGPGLGGILIAVAGVGWVYAIDAVSVIAMVFAAITIAPQRPHRAGGHEPILTSVASGLRFVRSSNALLGSFVIDLFAMTFGMPRVLFVVLSVKVFHAGAAGAGLLYAAVAVGAAFAALTNGWLAHARWIGRITIGMVVVWGAAIAASAATSSLPIAAALLAVAGGADSISAVCRSTIAQLVTTDEMRGRMTSVFGLVVTGGVRLGDIEAGSVASLTSPRFSVASGGLACVASVGFVLLAFPSLASFDAREHASKPAAAPA